MATINPFADDNVKGEIWELGYLAGFDDPDGEHFPGPIADDLLEIYQRGEQEGGADRSATPANSNGAKWVSHDFDFSEDILEHVIIHAFGIALEKVGVAAGGLISLVLTVVTIPGDVQLRPLEPESGPLNSADDEQEGNTYVAVCPRSDHPLVLQGATNEGYWIGPGRSTFVEAVGDMRTHGHAEAFVARCSVTEETCGPVWAVQ
jgi:hypothetical protein